MAKKQPKQAKDALVVAGENPSKSNTSTEVVKAELVVPAEEERREQERTRLKKKMFLQFFAKTYGNIKKTCEGVSIDRTTFYEWRSSDPEFRSALHRVEVQSIEDVEGVLSDLVSKGHAPSVHFFLQARSERFKKKTQLEVIPGSADGMSFEDEVDELAKRVLIAQGLPVPIEDHANGRDNKENTPPADPGEAVHSGQEEGDGAVHPEQSTAVLPGASDEAQHHTEGPAKRDH